MMLKDRLGQTAKRTAWVRTINSRIYGLHNSRRIEIITEMTKTDPCYKKSLI
jgi:hypothetical protein